MGLLADVLARRSRFPRVTLLIVVGFIVGPSVLALLPDTATNWFPLVADMALAMVGFLLGGQLTRKALREHGRPVMAISISVVLMTAILVGLGLIVIGVSWPVALILAGIAPATAPAAVADVVYQSRAEGRFTRTLLGIVAVDDAWGLILFSLLLAGLEIVNGISGADAILHGMWEIGGAVLIGLAIGIPMSALTGRIQPGEPTLAEALGGVFLCAGITLWFDASFLTASMVLGATVANLARHHRRPFHAIEGIRWPFMILFFVFAGASLNVGSLSALGGVLLVYVLLRILGRLVGAELGGRFVDEDRKTRHWMGIALLPQAGVALGMALVVSERIPEVGQEVLQVAIAATVIFELLGPIATRIALERAGECAEEG